MSVQSYKESFTTNKPIDCTGLCGRIVRGVNPKDFESLTDDPSRKLVMLMGPDGLEKLLEKRGVEALEAIGYERDYIRQKVVDENNVFKLVVFKESKDAQLATWEGVAEVVPLVYPETEVLFQSSLKTLKQYSFETLERAAGYVFKKVDSVGQNHPWYMSADKLSRSYPNGIPLEYVESMEGLIPELSRPVIDLRAFLYFTVYLKELFAGDGYTYTPEGQRSLTEYITPNRKLEDLGDHVVIDIPMDL